MNTSSNTSSNMWLFRCSPSWLSIDGSLLHGRLHPTHGTLVIFTFPSSVMHQPTYGIFQQESAPGSLLLLLGRSSLKTLYTATSMQSTTAAAETFSKKISLWIKKLQTHAKTCPGINCRFRKAAALMIKHRAANLT